LQATGQVERYQRLLIEVFERVSKSEEDRFECAAAMKLTYSCFGDFFIDLFYTPYYK
jgi:hypothetical protein